MGKVCKHWKLAFFLFLVNFVSAQQEESNYQQVPVCASIPQHGCPGVTFHLPRDNQVTDYVRYRSYVPMLKEGTICAWIETNDFSNNAVVSYATSEEHNAITINLKSTSTYLHIDGPGYRLETRNLDADDLNKFHLCAWWSTRRDQIALYINALQQSVVGFSGSYPNGGGDLILGQDQDAVNAGELDPSQSFSGNITNFMIWPRVLSDQEIDGIARNCFCPYDYAVAMTMDRVELHGEAQYSLPDECPTL